MYGSHPQALNKVKFSFPFPSALHTEDGSINQHTHVLNSGWMSNKRQLTERITSRSAKAVKTRTAMWIFQSKFPILPLPIIPCTQTVYLMENLSKQQDFWRSASALPWPPSSGPIQGHPPAPSRIRRHQETSILMQVKQQKKTRSFSLTLFSP